MKVENRTFSSWQALSALALGAFVLEFGCAVEKEDNDESQMEITEEDELLETAPEEVRDALTDLLADVWPLAIEPALAAAESRVAELKTAIETWKNDSGSAEAKTNAQDAWAEALRAWQVLELMQIGPAASSLKAIGGENIRDNIYSWPVTNPCRVDQVTCRFDYQEPDYVESALPNVLGFDALETILFSAPNENSCSSNSGINRDGTWDDVGAEGIAQSRADFADTLTAQIAVDLQRIRAAWEGGFGEEMATAGQGSTVYDTSSKALNAVYDGLFYIETFVKDRKLGWPLNERDCGQEDCTDEVESIAAGSSHEWVASNLDGFRALYTGGEEGVGMYDLLVSVEEDALANSVLERLDEADAAVATLTAGLNDTVRSDPDKLREVYDAVKGVTDLVKIDIPTVLSLQVPSEAAGDND